MNWQVTYRNKDGGQEKLSLAAESREEVFKELSRRGIKAMRVEQASGKAAPRPAKEKDGGTKPPPASRGIAAGVAVVAAALVALYFLLSPKKDAAPAEEPSAKQEATKIETSQPGDLPEPVAEPVPPPPKQPEPPKPLPPQKVGETRDGYILLPSGRLHRVLGVVTNSATAAIKGKYEIFEHACENEIAGFLTMEPGQGLVGTPRYNGRFKRDFLESLKHPIVISPDDSPEDAALKRNVIQAKKDLKEALDRGEDIEQIMLDVRKEMQDLARYKQLILQQMHETVKGSEMSVEEMEVMLTAANKLLDEKGIAPITFGPLTRRKIMMMREQEAADGAGY